MKRLIVLSAVLGQQQWVWAQDANASAATPAPAPAPVPGVLLSSTLSLGVEDGTELCPQPIMTQLAEAIANAANSVSTGMLSATFTLANIRMLNISGCAAGYAPVDAPAARRLGLGSSASALPAPARRLPAFPTVDFHLLAATGDDADAFMSLEVPATFAANINTSFFASSGIVLTQVNAGAFAPGCTVLASPNSMDPPCAEGSMISTGSTCNVQCAGSGYQPTVPLLTCNDGTIESFQCTGRQCHAPAHPDTDSLFPSCAIGDSILDGEQCTPRCRPGMLPDVPALTCTAGALSPLNFTCSSPNCRPPSGIAFAGVPSCLGLVNVTPGGICTPVCAPGYTPSVPSLTCGLDGGYVGNASFICVVSATLPTTPAPFVSVPTNDTSHRTSPLALDVTLRSVFVVWGLALLGTCIAAARVLSRAASGGAAVAATGTGESGEVEALVSGS